MCQGHTRYTYRPGDRTRVIVYIIIIIIIILICVFDAFVKTEYVNIVVWSRYLIKSTRLCPAARDI